MHVLDSQHPSAGKVSVTHHQESSASLKEKVEAERDSLVLRDYSTASCESHQLQVVKCTKCVKGDREEGTYTRRLEVIHFSLPGLFVRCFRTTGRPLPFIFQSLFMYLLSEFIKLVTVIKAVLVLGKGWHVCLDVLYMDHELFIRRWEFILEL